MANEMFCPKCAAPVVSIERRMNGLARCSRGHSFPNTLLDRGTKYSLFIPIRTNLVDVLPFRFGTEGLDHYELDCHLTFLYCRFVGDPEVAREIASRYTFEGDIHIAAKEVEVFRGVDGGTLDCHVLRVEVPKAVIKLRELLLDELSKAVTVELTYPEFKPHITIGYYALNAIPKSEEGPLPEPKFFNGTFDAPDIEPYIEDRGIRASVATECKNFVAPRGRGQGTCKIGCAVVEGYHPVVPNGSCPFGGDTDEKPREATNWELADKKCGCYSKS